MPPAVVPSDAAVGSALTTAVGQLLAQPWEKHGGNVCPWRSYLPVLRDAAPRIDSIYDLGPFDQFG